MVLVFNYALLAFGGEQSAVQDGLSIVKTAITSGAMGPISQPDIPLKRDYKACYFDGKHLWSVLYAKMYKDEKTFARFDRLLGDQVKIHFIHSSGLFVIDEKDKPAFLVNKNTGEVQNSQVSGEWIYQDYAHLMSAHSGTSFRDFVELRHKIDAQMKTHSTFFIHPFFQKHGFECIAINMSSKSPEIIVFGVGSRQVAEKVAKICCISYEYKPRSFSSLIDSFLGFTPCYSCIKSSPNKPLFMIELYADKADRYNFSPSYHYYGIFDLEKKCIIHELHKQDIADFAITDNVIIFFTQKKYQQDGQISITDIQTNTQLFSIPLGACFSWFYLDSQRFFTKYIDGKGTRNLMTCSFQPIDHEYEKIASRKDANLNSEQD